MYSRAVVVDILVLDAIGVWTWRNIDHAAGGVKYLAY